MRNPLFVKVLDEMEALHERKNHDYASDSNPFSNFEFAAQAAGTTVDQVFATLLGVKQARLQELTVGGKTPNHESVRDNLLDEAVYAALRLAYYDWVTVGRPRMHAGQGVLFSPEPVVFSFTPSPLPEPEGGPLPDPSFQATLDAIDRTVGTMAVLNPRRHPVDVNPFPSPNPVLDVADLHVEGD